LLDATHNNQTDSLTAPNPADANRPGAKKNIRGIPSVLPEFPKSPTTEPSNNDTANLNAEDSTVNNGTNNTNAAQPPPNATNPITSKLPSVLTDAPGSLMQKFSDFTHSAIGGVGGGGAAGEGGEAAEGSILSKGKDMLFKRFGF